MPFHPGDRTGINIGKFPQVIWEIAEETRQREGPEPEGAES
jgi:hypothetical protein